MFYREPGIKTNIFLTSFSKLPANVKCTVPWCSASCWRRSRNAGSHPQLPLRWLPRRATPPAEGGWKGENDDIVRFSLETGHSTYSEKAQRYWKSELKEKRGRMMSTFCKILWALTLNKIFLNAGLENSGHVYCIQCHVNMPPHQIQHSVRVSCQLCHLR